DMPSGWWDPNSPGPFQPWWNFTGARQAAQARIKTFVCPSDDPYSGGSTVYLCFAGWVQPTGSASSLQSQPTMGGGWAQTSDAFASPVGRPSYFGVAGTGARGDAGPTNWDTYTGVFTNRSRNKLATVADGTSNTLMFGEMLGTPAAGGRQSSIAWM